MMTKTEYSKLRTKILGIIEGLTLTDPMYFNVRRAMVYAELIHCNHRRDGTPEFSHQLEMLSLALSLHSSLIKPYEVYMAIILHDTIEDYPETFGELSRMFPVEVQYSIRLAKVPDTDTDEKTYYQYFKTIAECEVCSVVKIIDRIHNLSTAPGVFSTKKISEYCDEVQEYFVPMMSSAKGLFNQRDVYEVLKFMLHNQVRTIRTFVEIINNKEVEANKTVTATALLQTIKGRS